MKSAGFRVEPKQLDLRRHERRVLQTSSASVPHTDYITDLNPARTDNLRQDTLSFIHHSLPKSLANHIHFRARITMGVKQEHSLTNLNLPTD